MSVYEIRKFLLFTLLSIPAIAQNDHTFKGFTVYADLFHIAVNAEFTVFSKNKWHGNLRTGYGGFRLFSENRDYQWIPVSVLFFYGMKNSHPEFGLGLVYAKGLEYIVDPYVPTKTLYFMPAIGYRFQKPSKGFFLKVAYLPLFRLKEYSDWSGLENLKHSAVLGLGYSFSRKRKL